MVIIAVNKVIVNGQTLLDLTQETLTSSSQLAQGVTAHGKDGSLLVGRTVKFSGRNTVESFQPSELGTEGYSAINKGPFKGDESLDETIEANPDELNFYSMRSTFLCSGDIVVFSFHSGKYKSGFTTSYTVKDGNTTQNKTADHAYSYRKGKWYLGFKIPVDFAPKEDCMVFQMNGYGGSYRNDLNRAVYKITTDGTVLFQFPLKDNDSTQAPLAKLIVLYRRGK